MKRHVFSFASREFFVSLVREFFLAIGALWTITESSTFFSTSVKDWIEGKWWVLVAFATMWAIARSWPKKSFSFQVNGRDTTIEMRIGDAFESEGALVVPANDSFDSDIYGAVSRADSVHGELLRRYYSSKPEHLDGDIEAKLKQLAQRGYVREVEGENRFEIGTVVPIRQSDRLFYLLALTRMSEAGRANCEVNDYREALAKLWVFISERGDKGTVVVPMLGTGHARLPLTRGEVFKDIVNSFVASCTERTYCDKLVIVIFSKDIAKFRIDVSELVDFLRLSCLHAPFHLPNRTPIGNVQDAEQATLL